ncbi:YHS domain-containing (seleno)protein [Yoonia sp. BS5-3]|uniref:YHS domain-containing (Seleno)protein n=1 Tax=Yoonia phaeophyticola TaxID=3137369 RepID=A0ABZ2V059_9RHOB
MSIRRRTLIIAAPAAGLLAPAAFAATPQIYAENGIVVDGSDVVAYFDQQGPVAGDPSITYEYLGATWHFANSANRDLFAANPVAYAPQYGGYCAFAISRGYTAPTDPRAWSIVDDKLYLNYSRRIRRRWEQDIPGNIAAGDANWPAVLDA